MTYAAVVAAAVKWWGTPSLATTLGVGVMWLNFSGALSILQKGKMQLVMLLVAWVMFLGSMFLPTHTMWGSAGWEAAWSTLTFPVRAWEPSAEYFEFLIWVLVIDLANVAQLLLPLTAIRLQRKQGKNLAFALCASMPAVWAFAGPTAASGYILWCASFLLALTAIPLNRVTLVTMHVVLASQYTFWLIFPMRI